MRLLVLKELNFFVSAFGLDLFALFVAFGNCVDLSLQFYYFVVQFCPFGFELDNPLLKVGFSVFSLQLLAHSEGD